MRLHLSPRLAAALCALACLAPACATDRNEPEPKEAVALKDIPPPPWTTRFLEEAVLAAQRIDIVGPIGLRDHLAIAQDAERHSHSESTTPRGYRIEQRQLEHADPTPIKAHLDGLTILADDALTVLESPEAREVVVEAHGNVFFRVVKTGEEKLAPTLRLVGAP